MLRNIWSIRSAASSIRLLNEVLSLNAQEYEQRRYLRRLLRVLNEVLSLNAQE